MPTRKPAKKKSNTGRKTIYSKALVTRICSRLAIGESLRSISRDPKMPCLATMMNWLVDGDHPEFLEQYELARKIQAETLADELFDITDDGRNDWMEKLDKKGQPIGWQLNGEHVQRSRLRVDARKWYLSKIVPRFQDTQKIDHTSSDGTMSPKDKELTDDELKEELEKRGLSSPLDE